MCGFEIVSAKFNWRGIFVYYYYYYYIFVNCNWVVTRWQYTFTHKQYIEQYKTNNTYNNTTILDECGPCPVLASITLAFALQPLLLLLLLLPLLLTAIELSLGDSSPYTSTYKTNKNE